MWWVSADVHTHAAEDWILEGSLLFAAELCADATEFALQADTLRVIGGIVAASLLTPERSAALGCGVVMIVLKFPLDGALG